MFALQSVWWDKTCGLNIILWSLEYYIKSYFFNNSSSLDFVCRFIEFVFALTRLVFCRVLFIMAGSMDMGHIRIFHDARNDQVMMSIEVSFIYTFFFPVNVGCVRVCLGLIILFILFFRI